MNMYPVYRYRRTIIRTGLSYEIERSFVSYHHFIDMLVLWNKLTPALYRYTNASGVTCVGYMPCDEFRVSDKRVPTPWQRPIVAEHVC